MFRGIDISTGSKRIKLLTFITGRNEVLAKVIFLHLFVILFTGGAVPDQVHPPGPGTPPRTRYPPGPGTPPRTRYTPRPGTPPRDQVHPPRPGTLPQTRYTPGTRYTPPAANSGIRSTIDRYASYWNAFLLHVYNSINFFISWEFMCFESKNCEICS